MIDNQFAFELSDAEVSSFDVRAIHSLANALTGNFTFIAFHFHPVLVRLKKRFQSLEGVSLFSLSPPEQSIQAHTDGNLLSETSRHAALNFVVSGTNVQHEWYTAKNPRMAQTSPLYANNTYALDENDLLFEMQVVRPVLITVDVPHRGHSTPGQAILVSLGFCDTFENVRQQIRPLGLMA